MKFLSRPAWALPIAAALSVGLLPSAASALNEFQKIKANDAAQNDNFGIAVSINNGAAIVGAWGDDDTASAAGSAYIFRNFGAGTWSQQQKLHAADAAMGDNFGASVSISGGVAVVGAIFDDNRGSAYVFRDNGVGNWSQIDKLIADDAADGDQFGVSIALSGNTAVVGAMKENGTIGSAYVFRDNGANDWKQIAKLTANDGAAGAEFGNAVAISGNTILVGAHFDSNPGGGGAGAVYVFQDNGSGIWGQVDKLLAADGSVSKQFGTSVAFNSNTAVIGAIGDMASGIASGAAYVFQRDGLLKWHQADKLTGSDVDFQDQFGFSVGLSGNTVVVGANQAGSISGSAYMFRDNGLGNWNQIAKLTASDAASADSLGSAVGFSGSTAIVGAPLANSPNDSGAAYFYSSVTASVAGDYNLNGRVDTVDYVIWRNSVGATGPALPADGNGDGVVSQLDYQLWRENFGISIPTIASSSVANVPEPATITLLPILAGLLACRRLGRPSRR